MSEEIELKPCPFCGETPAEPWQGTAEGPGGTAQETWFIECCVKMRARTQQGLVSDWNTRVSVTPESEGLTLTCAKCGRTRQGVADVTSFLCRVCFSTECVIPATEPVENSAEMQGKVWDTIAAALQHGRKKERKRIQVSVENLRRSYDEPFHVGYNRGIDDALLAIDNQPAFTPSTPEPVCTHCGSEFEHVLTPPVPAGSMCHKCALTGHVDSKEGNRAGKRKCPICNASTPEQNQEQKPESALSRIAALSPQADNSIAAEQSIVEELTSGEMTLEKAQRIARRLPKPITQDVPDESVLQPEPVCTCFAAEKDTEHATYCPREGMDYDPITVADLEKAANSARNAERERRAKTGFDAVMAIEGSENHYSALQKAASVAAAIRATIQLENDCKTTTEESHGSVPPSPVSEAKDCICHQGSVCTPACSVFHHDGCRAESPSASPFCIVPIDGGFEPRMLTTSGDSGSQFWTPLLASGYWAEPASFTSGKVAGTYPLPTNAEAEAAIERAKLINQDRPLISSIVSASASPSAGEVEAIKERLTAAYRNEALRPYLLNALADRTERHRQTCKDKNILADECERLGAERNSLRTALEESERQVESAAAQVGVWASTFGTTQAKDARDRVIGECIAKVKAEIAHPGHEGDGWKDEDGDSRYDCVYDSAVSACIEALEALKGSVVDGK